MFVLNSRIFLLSVRSVEHMFDINNKPGVRIRIRMDPHILDTLDPDPHFFADLESGYLFRG